MNLEEKKLSLKEFNELVTFCFGNEHKKEFVQKEKVNQEDFVNLEKLEDLEYWRLNAEEDYGKAPISVLRYITELEKYSKTNT